MPALHQRIIADLKNFQKVLRPEGYYDAELHYRVDRNAPTVVVSIEVATGPKYRLKSVAIRYRGPGSEEPDLPVVPDDPELIPGNRATARRVVSGEKRFLTALTEIGHPLARLVDRKAVVDRLTARGRQDGHSVEMGLLNPVRRRKK